MNNTSGTGTIFSKERAFLYDVSTKSLLPRERRATFYFRGSTINVTCSLNKGGLTNIDELLKEMCFLVFLA